jgi:hypothetical protein
MWISAAFLFWHRGAEPEASYNKAMRQTSPTYNFCSSKAFIENDP